MRRLDSELFKFKCELEADHNGITEILEKRSLELESGSGNGSGIGTAAGVNSTLANNTPNAGSQKENRFFGMLVNSNSNSNTPQNRERYRARPEKRRNSSTGSAPPEKRPMLSIPSTSSIATASASSPSPAPIVTLPSSSTSVSTPQTPTIPFNIQQQLATANAICATPNVTQPLPTTQQLQQGRRASGVHATANNVHDLLIGRDMNAAPSPSTPGIPGSVDREGNAFGLQRRQKK